MSIRIALAVALVVVMEGVAAPAAAEAQRLVLLVRHAERADGGVVPPGLVTPADPDLSAEGKSRAERLAGILAEAGVTRVVVTEFKRTQQTAQPTVDRLRLAPDLVPAADVKGLAERLSTAYRDDIVLVVGHSGSVPATIAALGGPTVTIAETDYGNLFVYVPATRVLTRLRY